MSLAVKVRCLHHTFNMPLFSKTDFLILYVEGVKKKRTMLRHEICLGEVQDKTYSQNLQKNPYIAYLKRKRNINYNNYRFPIHKISSIFIYFFLWFQLEMIKTGRKG